MSLLGSPFQTPPFIGHAVACYEPHSKSTTYINRNNKSCWSSTNQDPPTFWIREQEKKLGSLVTMNHCKVIPTSSTWRWKCSLNQNGKQKQHKYAHICICILNITTYLRLRLRFLQYRVLLQTNNPFGVNQKRAKVKCTS